MSVGGHEPGIDLPTARYHRQPLRSLRPDDVLHPRQLDLEDLPLQEEDLRQRLVLRRRRHLPVDGQVGQVRFHLRSAHVTGITLAMEQDEPPDPMDVGLLCTVAVAQPAYTVADLVEEARLVSSHIALAPRTCYLCGLARTHKGIKELQ